MMKEYKILQCHDNVASLSHFKERGWQQGAESDHAKSKCRAGNELTSNNNCKPVEPNPRLKKKK
jgi:hypothetical protein